MSEKRFDFLPLHRIINDTVERRSYYLEEKEDVELIVDLLNGLYEENEQLRQTNEKLNKEKQRLIYHMNQPPER